MLAEQGLIDLETELQRWNEAGAVFGLPPDTLEDFYVYAERVHER